MAVIVFVVLILALDHTKIGHEIHYIGENHTASRFTGIDNEKVIMKVYSISGLATATAAKIVMGCPIFSVSKKRPVRIIADTRLARLAIATIDKSIPPKSIHRAIPNASTLC